MIVKLSSSNSKASSVLLSILLLVALMLFSCQKDTKVDLLRDSSWKYLGDTNDCRVYYSFANSTYTSINPCYDFEGKLNKVAWETGTYQITSKNIQLTIENSCEEFKIGQLTSFDYSVTAGLLTLTNESSIYEFEQVSSMPKITKEVEKGYWSFDQYGYTYWNRVDSCSFEN